MCNFLLEARGSNPRRVELHGEVQGDVAAVGRADEGNAPVVGQLVLHFGADVLTIIGVVIIEAIVVVVLALMVRIVIIIIIIKSRTVLGSKGLLELLLVVPGIGGVVKLLVLDRAVDDPPMIATLRLHRAQQVTAGRAEDVELVARAELHGDIAPLSLPPRW